MAGIRTNRLQFEPDNDETMNNDISLRDYFAAKAMQSIISQKEIHDSREWVDCAWISYQVAEAMITVRDKVESK